MFDELDALQKAGVTVTSDRMVVSDRAHMLFDLHKEVDGLREAELSGNKIGTTKRGIGPAYASKATRNGVRVGDIRNPEKFEASLRALAADAAARFDGFEYDVEAEIAAYAKYAERIKPFIADTVALVNAGTGWEEGADRGRERDDARFGLRHVPRHEQQPEPRRRVRGHRLASRTSLRR